MNVLDRVIEVYRATLPRAPWDGLAHPFGSAPHIPHEWRVSRDVWDELVVELRPPHFATMTQASGYRLLGEPIWIDETLPPNSMLLEPAG